MVNILIHISALQKGFLMTLGKILKNKNKVSFIARDKNIENLLKKNFNFSYLF